MVEKIRAHRAMPAPPHSKGWGSGSARFATLSRYWYLAALDSEGSALRQRHSRRQSQQARGWATQISLLPHGSCGCRLFVIVHLV